MKPTTIHLGFEIGTGKAVAIPLKHMAVTGQTQESGKTTTLEALAVRSGLKMLAFTTKRGERGFASGRVIPPFFQERADWEFIESILESTMRQRMKFERAWIVRACKGANTLGDVQRNVAELMGKAKRSMDQDMYMLLGEYLRKVVPLVARLPKTNAVELESGLNVMNLLDYPEELQMLVIGATLRWIHAHAEGVVTIIPEAWKFVPQGRKTPVKLEVERLAREGAGIKNYIWIDSQDMAGVEKLVLRAAAVWLVGVQREMNEVKRALGNIPAGIKRPKAEDVAQLRLGEFYACWQDNIFKTYIQPAWLDAATARAVAMGQRQASELGRPAEPETRTPVPLSVEPPSEISAEEEMIMAEIKELKRERAWLKEEIADLKKQMAALRGQVTAARSEGRSEESKDRPVAPSGASDLDAVYAYVRDRLQHDPQILQLVALRPEIELEIRRETIAMDTATLIGRLAQMVAEDFFDAGITGTTAIKELERNGLKAAVGSVYGELGKLAGMGFLYVEPAKDARGRAIKKYRAVPGMKVNIVREK